MKNWSLGFKDPGAYIIASDARLGDTNYINDHIWELVFAQGDPPALALQTTFGLRARNLRLFPRFVEGDTAIIDPSNFFKSPIIRKFYPNYLKVSLSPFEGIDVILEFFVPSSNLLTGRIQVINSRLISRKLRVQLAALLTPNDDGNRMAQDVMEAVTILRGKTSNIYPVIFMTGGPKISAGPYPALSVEMEMAPGAKRDLIWVHAAESVPQESFELARKTASILWDPEIARLDVLNHNLLEISTGDDDWNSAFALAQKCAIGLLVGPTKHLPHISCVSSRLPDMGYSTIGDGSDYDHLWNGQTPLEVYHLSNILLPAYPHLAKGLLLNFLSTQNKSGYVDLKPGLAGQRRRMLATPILVDLSWRIYKIEDNTAFIKTVFPQLLNFTMAWFSNQQDRDGDGLPEWSRPIQSGFEDHPVFSQLYPGTQGGDISKTESPSLCAFLYNEIQLLIKMAQITQQPGSISALRALSDSLRSAIETSWDESDSIYRNWDRETHFSPNGENLGRIVGPGILQINREFKFPVRLAIRIKANEEVPSRIKIFLHGIGQSGNYRIERILGDQIRWYIHDGSCSSEQTYTTVETIEVTGLTTEDQIVIDVMDLSILDHTLFLPLWAGIPDQDRAAEMIDKNLKNIGVFWKGFGISSCPSYSSDTKNTCNLVHMLWNNFIGEGLLRYGYRQEAAELFSNLMTAFIINLKKNKSFNNYYHANTGIGHGERNVLNGLIPIHLFLKALGVQIRSPQKVYIEGKNPYPWPVTLRYQGLTIFRESHRTKITFPGGQSAIIKNDEPKLITLE